MADEFYVTFYVLCVSGVVLLFAWGAWMTGQAILKKMSELTDRR